MWEKKPPPILEIWIFWIALIIACRLRPTPWPFKDLKIHYISSNTCSIVFKCFFLGPGKNCWSVFLFCFSFSPSASLPGTQTHQAPRGWSLLPSPPTISSGKTRGLLNWRESSASFPRGLSLHLGSAPTTCSDTEDAAHYIRGLCCEEPRAAGAHETNWTILRTSPAAFLLWHKHTNTHSYSLPACLRDPHHCVSRLSS